MRRTGRAQGKPHDLVCRGVSGYRCRVRLLALLISATVVGSGVLFGSTSQAETEEGHRVPLYGTSQVDLPLCKIPADLDCVESVRVSRNGEVFPLELTSPPDSPHYFYWRYTRGDGSSVAFHLQAVLLPLGDEQAHRALLYVGVDRIPDADNPWSDGTNLDCSSGVLADCVVYEPLLPLEDRFYVAVRTSWLRPLMVSNAGSDFQSKWQPIAGGHRFELSAKQMLLPDVDYSTNWDTSMERPRGWDGRLYFIVDHAADDPAWSAFDTRCVDKGFPIVSRNAPAAGRPEWIGKSLNFAVVGPHYAPDGTLFRGQFQAKIPLAWLRCRSGLTGLRPASLSVQVVSQDGEEQVATTALSVRNGMLHVSARDFHFSQPTVRLVANTRGK
jgi:hypothetical protein